MNEQNDLHAPVEEATEEERRAAFRKKAKSNATFSTRVRRTAATVDQESSQTSPAKTGALDVRRIRDCFDGVGVLLPWNAFISAFGYFNSLYLSRVQSFTFLLSMAFNIPGFLTMFAAIRFGPNFSFASRTLSSLILSLLSLAAVPFVCQYLDADISLILVFVLVLLTSVAGSILFGSVIGLAAIFPPRFTGAVMMGNGVAGIVATGLLMLISAFVSDAAQSALIYFMLSSGILLLCVVLFIILLRLPITQTYDSEHKASQRSTRSARAPASPPTTTPSIEHTPLLAESVTVLNEESINAAAAYKTANAIDMTDSPTASTVASVNRSGSIASSRDDKAVPSPVVDGDKHDDDEIVDANGIRQISRFKVFRRIKMPAICVFAVFFVTLTLFPGILTLIPSVSTVPSWRDTWFHLVLTASFMVGDWLGRSTPSLCIPISAKRLWIPVAVRFVYFPLFVWCYKDPISDAIPIAVVLTMAYTNGLFGTSSMIFGPSFAKQHERETAGLIMSFFLNLGIVVGSNVALLMRFALTGTFGIFGH